MSANMFIKQADRNSCSVGSLNRGWDWQNGRCISFGLKKGLRRARRRISKKVIERELSENYGRER
jgi:hypothetical protein